MANDYDDDDFDSSDPAGLRKALKERNKRIKDLEAENGTLRSQGRERTVKDVLAAKGVANASKIAKLIPADVSDEDSVTSWLTEFGDVFGISTEADGAEPAQPNGYTAEQQQALNTINGASVGTPIEANTDLATRIRNAETPEELQRIAAGG